MIGYRNNSSNITINTHVNTQPSQISPDAVSSASVINKAGQTFYEIITQQPYKFSKNDISINTYVLTLRWNYDSIIAMQENDVVAKLSNIADYAQNLPFIRKIYLEIAGTVDAPLDPIYNNMWIPLHEMTISGDYNVYDYKHYVFQRENYSSNSSNNYNKAIHNIISKSLPFSIRVYGENYSANYPSIETRALIFKNLSFVYINPPYKPQFIGSASDFSANVSLKNYVTLTYYNAYSIMNETSGNASITNYNIDYRVNTTLASNLISRYYVITNQNIDTSFSSAVYSTMSFNITLANLMSGSNYYHKIKVKNIYSNTYSEYSDISVSKYTLIPSNNNIGTSLDMSINPICYKRISNNDISNGSVLYFNVVNSTHKLIFNNSSIQPFQITHPYFASQHLEPYHYGYGKFIDNSLNLVTITMSINSVLKQIINYGGFDVSGANANAGAGANANANSFNYSMNNYTNNRIIHNCNDIEDIYDNETSYSNKGFRLKGYFSVIDEITNNNIINYFGDPSSNPYILNINYSRDPSVDNSLGSNITHYIYIDNFIGDPSLNSISNIVNVHEVVYNMSVASIKYFELALYRNYTNINSIYKYIVGNRIIANYSTTNNISLTSQNIILAQSDICANGTYVYNDISYTHIAYFQKTGLDFSFNLTEKIYNLNNSEGVSINNKIITNHYCDYNSFTKTNNVIVTSKLNLTVLHIYEIKNIEIIGSALNNIQLQHYTNHDHEIMSSTLLYLDSYFNNNFSLYPNSTSYNYSNNNIHHNNHNNNNLNISYNTYGTISYNLNGSVDPSNQGYKWIVFKIYKSTGLSNSYVFNNNNYSIQTTTDGIKYLPLKTMLKTNYLFSDAIVDNIFDITKTNALMFGQATTISSNKRFFNIKRTYNTFGGTWTENSNSNGISYYNTASSNIYGSNVNSEGIYCPIIDLQDDLTIYIGLKNNV
jgi:hypothetical protein